MEKPMREDIEFDAEGVTLRGWFYQPDDASGEVPCIILTHGFSCTKDRTCKNSLSSFLRVSRAFSLLPMSFRR